jgi:hypothetical protein
MFTVRFGCSRLADLGVHAGPISAVVEANVAAFRWITSTYRMLGIATSEANRAAYRDGGLMQASMAAGAESRSIEYAAQTMIVLRADDAEPDTLFLADVAKNRARLKGAFSFRLNREQHTITSVEDGQLREERKEAKRAEQRASLQADAVAIARELYDTPGLTTNRLHEALRVRHGSFSEGRSEAGLKLLGAGVERRDGANRSKSTISTRPSSRGSCSMHCQRSTRYRQHERPSAELALDVS